jgi:copper chaperone CopZ
VNLPLEEVSVNQFTLVIGGMNCRRCIRRVTRWLRDVPGVETLAVDVASSSVRLTGTMAEEDVLGVFAGTYYAPRVIDESGQRPDRSAPDR